MDIALLSKMIGELLLDHEEVGLPGLGAFLAEMVPASFSDRGYTINPPYRRVTFIPSRSEDDSLVELYAQSNGIDYDQSKAILQHFLEEAKRELLEKKVVVFPGLGRLRSTRQNNFFFITDEDLDIFPDGFGLPAVSLKNHLETKEEVRGKVEELVSLVDGSAPAELPVEEVPAAIEETPLLEIAEPDPAELTPIAESSQPAPVSEPESVPETPAPAFEPESAPETPAPAPTAEPEPAPEAPAISAPTPPSAPEKPARPKKVKAPKVRKPLPKWLKTTLIVILVLVALAAVALAAFVILAQAAPDFIDSILYTPEELRIINYQ